MNNSQESVIEVFVTRVSLENYDAYQKWVSKVEKIEAKFPGYQGMYVQPPDRNKGGNWITMLRFDTPQHLDDWLTSGERREILKESEPIVESFESHRVVSSFAGWFSDISKMGEAPPVWKQTMLVLLVLFPLVMLELKFLNPLLVNLNLSLATFIGNAITVTLISWPMIPIVIRFLKWWFIPNKKHPIAIELLGTLTVIILYILCIAFFWHFL